MGQWRRVACFTDIHWGKHSDSETHNQDCSDFVDWFVSVARARECDSVIFLGDWNDCRSRIRVDTMDFGRSALQRLVSHPWEVHFLVGNHDLFFRHNREVHSIPRINSPNFHIVDDPMMLGDTLLCPWLCSGDEYQQLLSYHPRYAFLHADYAGFLMNSMVLSPDRGRPSADDWVGGPEYAFSGHYHMRQWRKMPKSGVEVHYIGNAFPHDFSDEGDTQRGMMILETGGAPEYINWPDAPTYRRVILSEMLDQSNLDMYNPRTTIRAVQDIPLSYEERQELVAHMREVIGVRDFTIQPLAMVHETGAEDVPTQEPVDQTVVEFIREQDFTGTGLEPALLEQLFLEMQA